MFPNSSILSSPPALLLPSLPRTSSGLAARPRLRPLPPRLLLPSPGLLSPSGRRARPSPSRTLTLSLISTLLPLSPSASLLSLSFPRVSRRPLRTSLPPLARPRTPLRFLSSLPRASLRRLLLLRVARLLRASAMSARPLLPRLLPPAVLKFMSVFSSSGPSVFSFPPSLPLFLLMSSMLSSPPSSRVSLPSTRSSSPLLLRVTRPSLSA
mmetsp:Transcript_34966/g.62858  ORF Transcript_34966/g.62858 Transcript_34966/m.62858 type:complete len:210 (-) Transcript_34966:1183-1812(-)